MKEASAKRGRIERNANKDSLSKYHQFQPKKAEKSALFGMMLYSDWQGTAREIHQHALPIMVEVLNGVDGRKRTKKGCNPNLNKKLLTARCHRSKVTKFRMVS
jgi:hypothetical protein